MADNVSVVAGAYTATVATDDVGGTAYQRVKIAMGADGAFDLDVDSGQQTMANSLPVTIASNQSALPITDNSGSLTVDGAVTITSTPASTPTQSTVNDNAANVTLLAANANRLGASIANDSSAALLVKLGATASTSSYTARLVRYALYEVPFRYTGQIDGIWESDPNDGAARITELTA